jgi:hypothetical protein
VLRGASENISETTLYRDDEYRPSVEEDGRNWSFDADGHYRDLSLPLFEKT